MATIAFQDEIFWLTTWVPKYFLLTKFQENLLPTTFQIFPKILNALRQCLLIVIIMKIDKWMLIVSIDTIVTCGLIGFN